ncbi:CPBP family intramembrane glutamic endopeptidase [Brachybacterium sp. p3-SID957]|uniref:CPBP family intramembrane glutamic endopeptidase n=1 Tax=Brachybacterium sp. p3-SID957 TaxID=2916049 RepID=UPI00223B6059|nr:CPBP family intramembrane glutamic endopeptidase [Brachybacterium sp. p3-SID957]MCT1775105.1 CPBP family intramembrane metalloprotease [Brachybacterium sp. p3-SID957]
MIRYSRVPWRRIGLFMLISYGLFALAAAPFWFLPGGIEHPAFTLVIAIGMWSPAVASLIMAKGVERVSWRTRVGLRFRGRGARILAWMPLGLVLVVAILLLSELVAAVRGAPMDLTGRTWLETGMTQVAEQTGQEIPAIALVLITVATVFAGLLVTTLATLGEEIGWRGWLWPALTPLGRIPAALVGGIIWSLWHLPVVLIGYNYPGANRVAAVAMFLLPCIAMTLLFGALTDRAGGSPLPAALAHAGINTLSGVLLGVAATTQTMAHYSHFLDGPLGIAGVRLMAVAGGLLLLGRREPALPHLDLLGDGRVRQASSADG